jgi:hypothetical protein
VNHLFSSLEEIESSVFFSSELAKKFPKTFFPILSHLLGIKLLRNSDLKRMFKYGGIEKIKYTEEEVISILKSKMPQKVDRLKCNLFDVCDWCKAETYNLHKHHYPIKRSKGGQTTVEICPNCHYEFHSLIDREIYLPAQVLVKAFEKSKLYKEEFKVRWSEQKETPRGDI